MSLVETKNKKIFLWHSVRHISKRARGVFFLNNACLKVFSYFPAILKLKAVDRGVVVIRGTEAGRYLAMNDEGRLYGSVSKPGHLQVNQLLLQQNEPSAVVPLSPPWRTNVTSWRSWRRTTTTPTCPANTRTGGGTWPWKRTAKPSWAPGLTADRRPSSFCPVSCRAAASENARPRTRPASTPGASPTASRDPRSTGRPWGVHCSA